MSTDVLEKLISKQEEYPFGFSTDVECERLPPGLNEDIIREISRLKNEPSFLLAFRLKAYALWKKMKEPKWAKLSFPHIDYNAISYYSAPKKKAKLGKLEDADPEILKTFQRLGIPLDEQKMLANVAVDMVFDSVSIGTTFKKRLEEAGVTLCSISEAIIHMPEIIERYLSSVVPIQDNFFSALNSAVFTDGSFVYVPKGVKCPIELSTYFRINDKETGQFERTLIVAEEGSYVSYLEGCTAPAYSNNQLHAAVVELIAEARAEIRYATVQNWYSGDRKTGKGGIYNFVTKRGKCKGDHSKISWSQVEVGASITWKYPSCILQGDHSIGEFYSVAVTSGKMQADTGTKMIHIGKNTKSTIVSKGISADQASNAYRGLVKVLGRALGARNYTQCDSMLIGKECSAHTFPIIEMSNGKSTVEHEASTSRINEEELFYFQSRGISKEEAIQIILTGFCSEVLSALPLEFAEEAKKLIAIKLENSVG